MNKDNVKIGNITVTNQIFGEAKSVDSHTDDGLPDGILGLAWPKIAIKDTTTVLQNMQSQGQLKENLFTFHLTREDDAAVGGQLDFGEINEVYYVGNITY